MYRVTQRSAAVWATAFAIACLSLSGVLAAEAGGRGLLDSVVNTLVGGNPGDGAADAKTVPLDKLQGGIARDSAGNIYFTENNRVCKLANGALSVIAGTKANTTFVGDTGLAADAVLNNPTYLAADSADSIYVVDSSNQLIRKMTKDGKISTVAGTGEPHTDNIVDVGRLAVDARINGPAIVGLAVDGAGNIFIADNAANMIYKIDTTGVLNAFAGNGLNGSAPNGAVALGNPLNGIRGLALLGNDVVYTEAGAVRLILADGSKNSVIAGAIDYTGNVILNRRPYFPDDGTRKALQTDPTPPALRPVAGGVVDPRQVAVDGTNIIFWDNSPGRYRMFINGGVIKTVFGEVGEPTSGIGYRGDGIVAAPNTPRGGIAILPGPVGLSTSVLAPGLSGDDKTFFDGDLGLTVVVSGANGIVETPAAGDDVQLVAVNSTTTIDYSKRNDDPMAMPGFGGLAAGGGNVTFVDIGNNLVRQFSTAAGGQVANAAGAFSPNRFENLGGAVPSVTSTTSASVQENAAFSYLITATNPPITFFNASGLPVGLSVDNATGVISGKPTPAAPGIARGNGVYKVLLTANNSAGTSRATTLTLIVTPLTGDPTISSAATASGAFAQNYTIAAPLYKITSNNGTSYSAVGLPAPLTVDAPSGGIIGTPAAKGVFNVTMQATNATGTTNAPLVLTITNGANAPSINSALTATGTQGTAYPLTGPLYTITATNTPTLITTSALPAGLIVTNAGVDIGKISGTPTVSGVFDITLTASNASGSDQKNLILTINPVAGAPVINSDIVATGFVGQPFSYTITATNTPTSFAVGFVPSGLAFDPATGLLSGTLNGGAVVAIFATNAKGTASQLLTLYAASLPGNVSPPSASSGSTQVINSQRISDSAPVPAKGAPITSPGSLAVDGSGNIYFDAQDIFSSPNSNPITKVYKYDPNAQTIAVVAGPVYTDGFQTKTGEGGAATGVSLMGLGAQASVAGDGSVFFADNNLDGNTSHTILKVDGNGILTHVAGIPNIQGNSFPDGDNHLLSADGSPSPVLSRVGQNGTGVMLNAPEAALSLSATDFLVGDTGNNSVLRVSSGKVTQDILLPGFGPSFLANPSANTFLVGSRNDFGGVPAIGGPTTATGQQGQLFVYNIVAPDAGGFNFAGDDANGWATNNLSLGGPNGSTISGVMTQSGSFIMEVQATNVGTASMFVNVTIAPTTGFPTVTSEKLSGAGSATVGAAFSHQVVATNSPTNFVVWVNSTDQIPTNGTLALNPATGLLSGTPAAGDEGRYDLTIQVTNGAGIGFGRIILDVNAVAPAIPVIVTETIISNGGWTVLPSGMVGSPYPGFTIEAINAPTSFAIAGGSLPAGLTLNNSGVIGGTPTADGESFAVITATNAAGTSGNFFADIVIGAGSLRKIDTSGTAPVVTTFGPSLNGLVGLALGTNGIFVANPDSITLIDSTTGLPKYVANNLQALDPILGSLTGLFVSGTTVRYATTTGVIREFTDNGSTPPVQTTLKAGKFFMPNHLTGTGGPGLQVGFMFSNLTPLAGFSDGTQLVGDDGALQFRRVSYTTNPVSASLVAGAGDDNHETGDSAAPATACVIGQVGGIAIGPDGTLYFSDQLYSFYDSNISQYKTVGLNTIRMVQNGNISTYAGIPGRAGYSGDGVAATSSLLSHPAGLAFSGAGELYFCDGNGQFYNGSQWVYPNNSLVRKVSNGKVVNVAGTPKVPGYAGDGNTGDKARFDNPFGLCFDKNGDLFICDTYNYVLRVIGANGIVNTLAGNDNGHQVSLEPVDALEAGLYPWACTVDTGGKIYTVSNYYGTIIRTARGTCQAVVGDSDNSGFNGDGLPGPLTLLDGPRAVLYAANLGLVFTDGYNNRVRVVTNLAEATNSAPTAVIQVSPANMGTAPYKAHFDGLLSTDPDGDIVSYHWDFGDGTTGDGVDVDHIYQKTGSYTVTLTVTDSQSHTGTAKLTVFAAQPVISSSTAGKGAFKVAFGPKATKPNDSFSLTMTNVAGLTNVAGKSATIILGSYQVQTVVLGKGVKAPKAPKTNAAKLTIDPVKKSVALAITKAQLAAAFADFGIVNANTIGTPTATIPVVISVDGGKVVIGDNFLFVYKSKFNSGSTGKFSQ